MADYPKQFEQFWKAYPRKVAKVNAANAWKKQGIEDDMYSAKAAVDDLEKRTRMGWWNKDKTKIPHPATWINSQRWHDEGWESDIEGHDRRSDKPRPFVPQEPERIVPWEEALIGRIFRSYVMTAGGLPDVDKALNIKGDLMNNAVPAFREEVEAERMSRQEVAVALAELFVRHMDAAYGLSLEDRVLRDARKAA
jgi:hypothetical protein